MIPAGKTIYYTSEKRKPFVDGDHIPHWQED